MGLFDYHKDQHALTHGPFVWRVRTEPLPKAEVKLEMEWRDVMHKRGARRYTDDAWAQLEVAMRQPQE